MTPRGVYGQIKADIERQGYDIAILYRVIEVMWNMSTTGILISIKYPSEPHLGIDHADFRITTWGRQCLERPDNFHHDPEGYVIALRAASSKVDAVIVQYAMEAMKCFKQGLIFAASVMIGAAAEKAILILFESVIEAAQDPNTIARLEKEMRGTAKLPTIYRHILDITEKYRKDIEGFDSRAYESSRYHVISLFDMIRRQRNDAVHPATAKVESNEVFLSMTSLPLALQVIYRLHAFFEANRGRLLITV